MFSHVVIFWTRPEFPEAAEAVVAGAERFLKPIPGMAHFHVGKMAPSPRPVVDQSYQVALNTVFPSQAEREAYRRHPGHKEFEEKILKQFCLRCVVYDFA